MRKAALVAFLIAPVLALAACGGGDDGDEQATATATESAEGVEEPVVEDQEAGEDVALLVIMDASGSMRKRLDDGGTRLEAAQGALRDLATELSEGTEVGLRVFGNAPPRGEGCEHTDLVSPVAPLDPEAMNSAVDGLRAKGRTPIALSLSKATDDLPAEGQRAIILVSDGQDSCAPPDPCDVASEIEGAGIDVLIETVGFALGTDDASRRQLECIAEAGGGSFHDVEDAEELAETLSEVSQGPAEWAGKWDTGSYGIMTLNQSGNEVEGTYTYFGGRISGTASGRTLTGRWSQAASPKVDGETYQGDFEFEMSPNGDRWTGTWTANDGGDGTWKGTRAPE